MSANGTITIVWANGEDTFCLAQVGHILDLEDRCGNVGIFKIGERLESAVLALQFGTLGGEARINDVRETIRLGLIGGGMKPEQAMDAVKRHVDPPNVLASNVLVAYEIVAACIRGVPGDAVGKKPDAEVVLNSTTMTAASADRPSSESGPPSNGTRGEPSDVPSGNFARASTGTTPSSAASPSLTP